MFDLNLSKSVKALSLCLAWEPNSRYVFKVQGRALTVLNENGDQHTGIMIRGDLVIEPKTRKELRGEVR